MTVSISLPELVDLRAFPIHDPAGAGYVAAVDTARAGLRAEGCAVLGGFVPPEAVARLNDEIAEPQARNPTTPPRS